MVESNADQQQRRHRRRGRKSDDSVVLSATAKFGRTDENSKALGNAKNNTTTTTIPGASSHSSLLISPLVEGELWYTCGPVSPERNAVLQLKVSPSTIMSGKGPQQQSVSNPADVVLKYRQQADQIYRHELQVFNSKKTLSSDDQWVETTIRKGTLKDRIAAMSVVISTDPIHKFHTLDSLLSMAGCQSTYHMTSSTRKQNSSSPSTPNSRVVQMAAEALEDLFIHTLLPTDRKLYTLSQRPLMLYEATNQLDLSPHSTPSNSSRKKKRKGTGEGKTATKRTLSPRLLLLWRFEEMVKERFDWFLRQYISRTLNDAMLHTGTPSASTSTSTMDGPKIAALRTASALIRSIPEGETFLLPLLVNKLGDPKATICSGTSYELRKILHVHPAMMDIVAREVQQLVHRPHLSMHAMYNCITFLNQLKLSRPNAASKDDLNEQPSNLAVSLMNTYFRLFDVAMLQQKEKSSPSKPSDSSTNYQTRLLSALLTGVNRAHPYVPSSKDANGNGAVALLTEHVDSLYRIVHTASPAAKTQSLLLLFHVAVGSVNSDIYSNGKKPDASSSLNSTSQKDRFYRALYATLSDPAMIGTGKHLTLYFNLLFKAMKYETDMSRLQAYTKRLWSTALHCSSAVLAASVFLIDAIAYEHHPTLFKLYRDVLSGRDALRILDPTKREPRGALVVFNDEGKKPQEVSTEAGDTEICAPGWEYTLTIHHYHPSVQKFTSIFGNSENITDKYTGDPLRDFAVAPFLDKFAYRNPKSTDRKTDQDNDISGKPLGVGSRRSVVDRSQTPLNDPSFIEKSTVHPHEEFFHKFFVERANRDAVKGIVRKKVRDDRDIDAAESEAFDRIESRNADQNMLANYDDWDQWETDDEEEAFVDSLAQQIIDDAMDGNAVDDLDAEDPDTEGWDDINEGNSVEDIGSEDDQNTGAIDDAYARMDQSDDDVSEGFQEEETIHEDELDDDGELGNDSSSEEDRQSDASLIEESDDDVAALVDDEDSEDDGIEALVYDGESDDDEAPVLVPVRPDGKSDKGDVFAAAEEYSEVIEKSWGSQKRQHHASVDEESEMDDDKNLSSSPAPSGNRRKRNRRSR
jgi:ribosome biogenesis protein MAK21